MGDEVTEYWSEGDTIPHRVVIRLDMLTVVRKGFRDPLGDVLSAAPLTQVLHLPDLGVVVVRATAAVGAVAQIDALRAEISGRAGFVVDVGLVSEGGIYPLYAPGVVVVRFWEDDGAREAELGTDPRWTVERPLPYASSAFVIKPRTAGALAAFSVAKSLRARPDVRSAYPVLAQKLTNSTQTLPEHWHLAATSSFQTGPDAVGADVFAAWGASTGRQSTVAVIELGAVEATHPQLRGSRSRKVRAAVDLTAGLGRLPPAPMPDAAVLDEAHGTFVAGMAVAEGVPEKDGTHVASGVAPGAFLIAIRCAAGIGNLPEADSVYFAACKGADVISCSWGPELIGTEPQPMPDHTRWAIEWALTHGRKGLGCPVVFSAGNEASNLDLNGYASDSDVIAVGACTFKGRAATYSNSGRNVWCVFPVGEFDADLPLFEERTRLLLLDLEGIARDGQPSPMGDYRRTWGMTSAAAAAVAGLIALMLDACPNARWWEVKRWLAQSATHIDTADPRWVLRRHPQLGWGRVNGQRAVRLALANCAQSPVSCRDIQA